MIKPWLVALALCSFPALAGDAIGNLGTVRGDYWTRFHDVEINVIVSAIPFVDLEAGLLLPDSVAHFALGPRIEVLPRESDAGVAIRLVVLFGAWFSLGNEVALTQVSASPGVEATYWFSRRFGITGSVSLPIRVPYSSGAGLSGSGTQASPRLGLGISF